MQNPFISSGNGYADDRTQDEYVVLFHPCPTRESRFIGRIDYSSHNIRLATCQITADHTSGLYLLINHGGGSETWKLSWSDKGIVESLKSIPEEQAYVILYAWYDSMSAARRCGMSETAAQYSKAFIEKRLKKSRPKQGRVKVTIDPEVIRPVTALSIA